MFPPFDLFASIQVRQVCGWAARLKQLGSAPPAICFVFFIFLRLHSAPHPAIIKGTWEQPSIRRAICNFQEPAGASFFFGVCFGRGSTVMWLYAADNSKSRRDKRVANTGMRQPLWFLLCLRPKTSN